MKLLWVHMGFYFKNTLRVPGFTIPTLLLPSLIYLFYGRLGQAESAAIPASFAAFAVFGVVFFQFGVSTTLDRFSPWAEFERSLPKPVWVVFGGRIANAMGLSLIAATLVLGCAVVWGGFSPSLPSLLKLYVALLLGAVPFGLLGIALGYWSSAKSALAIANLLYLVLSFLGGLWVPPSAMPESLQQVAQLTPTYHWGMLVWQSVLGYGYPWSSLLWLLGYTLCFYLLAKLGFNRARV
jgi:ABC-2 type transport system permease protein